MTREPHGNTKWGPEHEARARRLWVEEDQGADAIASVIGCSARQVHRWAKAGAWRQARQVWANAQAYSIEDLEERALRKVLHRLERDGDAMQVQELLALLKHTNSFKALIAKRQGYRLVDAALVVGDDFEAFVLNTCPAEAPVLLQAWKNYLDDLQKRSNA